MTQEEWNKYTPAQREALRDNSDLTKQLIGLEGKRVEVVTTYGETRIFTVGRSTGWKPIHLEKKTSRCDGGFGAEKEYKSVRVVG